MPESRVPRDCVSSAEFSRYVLAEDAYRSRVAHQLEVQYGHISAELTEIKRLVHEANGKTNKNGEAIAVLQRELEAMESEESHIESVVDDIKAHGCAQLAAHQEVLNNVGWSTKKKAAVSAGLIGTGAVAWPVIQQIVDVVHHYVAKTP
jgi:chromosome segregation ATPase